MSFMTFSKNYKILIGAVFAVGAMLNAPMAGAAEPLKSAGEEAKPETRVAPCKYYRIPAEYGVVSSYDALLATDDGKAYIGTSTYTHPATLIELDRKTGKIRVVSDVGQVAPQDDLSFLTQSKIHTFLNLSANNDVIYFGTHTGEPDATLERPRMYFGGHFMAYDRKTGVTTDYGIGRPRDALLRVSLDEKRGKMYGITYPWGHMIVCDMKSRSFSDLGKVSISQYSNPWIMWDGKVYFSSKLDEFSCFDPDSGEIRVLPVRLPDIDGEPQELTFRSFLVMSKDGKRLYGYVSPGKQLVEWDLSRPPGKMTYLGGEINVHSMVFSSDEKTLYLPGWNGNLHKYDMLTGKFYNLGFLQDGETRIGGLYGACSTPDGKIIFSGNALQPDGKPAPLASWGYCGFWEFEPAVEPGIEKEVWGKDTPPKRGLKMPDRNVKGLLSVELNKTIPYGESAIRTMICLQDGSALAATAGKKNHLLLIEKDQQVARDLGVLPEGEFPAYGGLVLDKDGSIYLGTIGDLETIYRMEKTPAGRIYRVVIDAKKEKMDLKSVATFCDDGIYTMTINPAGAVIYGVTFPGGHLFSMLLADGKVTDYGALVADARPQNKNSNKYNWMQIPLGRQIAFDRQGHAYVGADGTKLRRQEPDGKQDTLSLVILGEGQIDALILGGDGKLYGGTDRGYLFTFDPESGKVVNLGKPTRQSRVRSLCWSQDRVYGICGETYGRSQIFSYHASDGFQLLHIPFGPRWGYEFFNDHFDVVLPAADGGLWLGGSGRMTSVLRLQCDQAKAK